MHQLDPSMHRGSVADPGQVHRHVTAGVNLGGFTTQLADFANHADRLVGEVFQVLLGDTGSCFGHLVYSDKASK